MVHSGFSLRWGNKNLSRVKTCKSCQETWDRKQMWMRPLKSSLVLAFSSFCKPQTRSDLFVSYVPYQHFCDMSITYMRRVTKVRRMLETLEIFIRCRDISQLCLWRQKPLFYNKTWRIPKYNQVVLLPKPSHGFTFISQHLFWLVEMLQSINCAELCR